MPSSPLCWMVTTFTAGATYHANVASSFDVLPVHTHSYVEVSQQLSRKLNITNHSTCKSE